MNRKATLSIFTLIWIFSFLGVSRALEIVEPIEGQRVELGSSLKIIVRPEIGENWQGVAVAFNALVFNASLGAYFGEFPVPRESQVGPREIRVTALSNTGQEIELKRNIIVTLPSNLRIQELHIDEGQNLLFFSRLGETERIFVEGTFSDGITRQLGNTGSGTTFESTDPTVVVVSPDGTVEARKNGKAIITIKNGDQQIQIQAVVKAKN